MKKYVKPKVKQSRKELPVESFQASGHRTRCNSAAKHVIIETTS